MKKSLMLIFVLASGSAFSNPSPNTNPLEQVTPSLYKSYVEMDTESNDPDSLIPPTEGNTADNLGLQMAGGPRSFGVVRTVKECNTVCKDAGLRVYSAVRELTPDCGPRYDYCLRFWIHHCFCTD